MCTIIWFIKYIYIYIYIYVLYYERGARKMFEFEVDPLDSASLVRLVFFLDGM